MILQDFLIYVMDEQTISIFNTESGETIYTGTADEIPENLLSVEFGSVDAYNDILTFNI